MREDFAAEAGKLAAGFAALVANQDVNLAAEIGDNAVQNNFIPAALFVGFMAYEGYQIYKTYQEEGAAAAALQLGFTVGTAVIGGVVVKNAFKFGGIAVRTAEEAILAYKAQFPMFGRFYDLAATAYQRGAASIAQLMQYAKGGPLANLTEKQWQSLVSWWHSRQNAMSAAPDIDTQDEGFTPHERGPQANVTPIADKFPTTFITPVPEDVRQILEGFNIHDGPSMNILYKELERINNVVKAYDVGGYDELKRRPREPALEMHHAPQQHPAKQVIDGYNPKNAPAIALPKEEHAQIPNIKGKYGEAENENARNLLAKAARDLRNRTNAPNNQIQELIDQAKNQYPTLTKK